MDLIINTHTHIHTQDEITLLETENAVLRGIIEKQQSQPQQHVNHSSHGPGEEEEKTQDRQNGSLRDSEDSDDDM